MIQTEGACSERRKLQLIGSELNSQQSGNSNLAQKCRFLSKIQILCKIYSFLKIDSLLFSFLKLAPSSSKTIVLAEFDQPLPICGLQSYSFPLAKMKRIIGNGLFSQFPGESASGAGSSQHLVASYILWSVTPAFFLCHSTISVSVSASNLSSCNYYDYYIRPVGKIQGHHYN